MSVVELDKTYYFEMTNDVDMTGIDWKPLNTGEPVDRFDIKIHLMVRDIRLEIYIVRSVLGTPVSLG